MTNVNLHGANGVLPLALGWAGAYASFDIYGGPYDKYPGADIAFGVCVREERAATAVWDVWLPIRDFDVPKDDGAVAVAIKQTLEAALAGRVVYVGCMGGWGRTGLFLALLAKAAGVRDPIHYVRKNYTPHAVETAEQKAYVQNFDVAAIRGWLFWRAWNVRARKMAFWWS